MQLIICQFLYSDISNLLEVVILRKILVLGIEVIFFQFSHKRMHLKSV